MKKFLFAFTLSLGISQSAFAWICACNAQKEGVCLNESYHTNGDGGYSHTNFSCHSQYLTGTGLQGFANANQFCTYHESGCNKCGAGKTFNKTTGMCECIGPNCAPIKLTKTFDFNVLSGGVDAKMYVCEVGFYKLCPTCDQHYLQVDGTGDKIKTHKTFTQSNAPSFANVYINDLYWGAEFYVKYCVAVERTTVGSDTSIAFDANISPSYSIQTGAFGSNTGYVEAADLRATVYKDCSGSLVAGNPAQGAKVGDVLDLVATATVNKTLPTDTLELCGNEFCQSKMCVYTLRFNEAATCYRMSKCTEPGCDEWGSTIKTTFNADVTFDCVDGICGN